jgi:hypothetical protein
MKSKPNWKYERMSILKGKTSIWGLAIYSLGVLFGMLLTGASVWGNFEAFLFDNRLPAEETISRMSCPLLITSSETGTVTASFSNPSDRSAQTTVRAHITDGMFLLMREMDTRLQLEPGETRQLEWTVFPEDAAWERFILVRIYSLRSPPLPSRTGTCGIIVVDIPFFSGSQIVALIAITSLIAMFAGLGIWNSANQPLSSQKRYALQIMTVLAALIVIGLVLSIFRLWFIGGILLVFTVLVIVVAITYFLIASETGGAL